MALPFRRVSESAWQDHRALEENYQFFQESKRSNPKSCMLASRSVHSAAKCAIRPLSINGPKNGSDVAGEPLWKVEPIMCALCPGEGCRRENWAGRETLPHLPSHAFLSKQRHTHS